MRGVRTPAGVVWDGTIVPALCLDLDGTVRRSKTGIFISGTGDIELFPGVEAKLWEYRNNHFLILGVSNQAGVAHGFKTVKQAEAELDATLALFVSNPFHLVKLCFHDAAGTQFPYNKRSLLRKPDIGMLAIMEGEAFEHGYVIDWDNSLFVGDRGEDEGCAQNALIPFLWAKEFFGREG